MIKLETRHLDILESILRQAQVRFYAFGSRTKNTNKKFSDLDLCYMEPIPRKLLIKIKSDLVDSNLPFKVDLIDWNKCDKEFQDLIKDDLVELKMKF